MPISCIVGGLDRVSAIQTSDVKLTILNQIIAGNRGLVMKISVSIAALTMIICFSTSVNAKLGASKDVADAAMNEISLVDVEQGDERSLEAGLVEGIAMNDQSLEPADAEEGGQRFLIYRCTCLDISLS